jgi:hypothetical protein
MLKARIVSLLWIGLDHLVGNDIVDKTVYRYITVQIYSKHDTIRECPYRPIYFPVLFPSYEITETY